MPQMETIHIKGQIGAPGKTIEFNPGFACSDAELRANMDHITGSNIHLEIDSPGGGVVEGIKMYDTLRMSGKQIHTNVNADCHSIAVVLLLSAPVENRSANPNARFLLHHVRGGMDGLSAQEARDLGDYLEREENNLIRIYSDRTGLPEDICRRLIETETFWSAQDMLQMGFIGKINQYSTNLKKQKMARRTKKAGILEQVGNFFSGKTNARNYEHIGTDGEVALITQKEDDSVEPGDAATLVGTEDENNGSVEIAGGLTVSVVDGEVVDVALTEELSEEEAEEIFIENDRALIAERYKKVKNMLRALYTETKSTHKPSPRSARVTTSANRAQANGGTSINRDDFDQILNSQKAGRAVGKTSK